MLGRSRRISTKLIVAVSVAVAAITAITTMFQWEQRQAAMSNSLRGHAGEIDATIDAALRDAMVKTDSDMMASMIGRVGKMTAVKRVYLLDAAGKVSHTSDPTMPGQVFSWTDFNRVSKSNRAVKEIRRDKGRPYLLSLSPVAADETCLSSAGNCATSCTACTPT